MHTARVKFLAVGVVVTATVGLVLALLPSRESQSASLNLVGVGTNQEEPFVMVRLTNAGPLAIEYVGEGTNHPAFCYLLQTAEGPANCGPDGCGMGLQLCLLKPGESVDFKAWLNPKLGDCQLAVTYTLPTSVDRLRRALPYRVWRWLPAEQRGTAMLSQRIGEILK